MGGELFSLFSLFSVPWLAHWLLVHWCPRADSGQADLHIVFLDDGQVGLKLGLWAGWKIWAMLSRGRSRNVAAVLGGKRVWNKNGFGGSK